MNPGIGFSLFLTFVAPRISAGCDPVNGVGSTTGFGALSCWCEFELEFRAQCTTNDRSYQVFPVIVTTRALPLVVSDKVGLNLVAVQVIARRAEARLPPTAANIVFNPDSYLSHFWRTNYPPLN